MNNIIIADTRNQVDDFAVRGIEKLGYTVKRSMLPFGDFAFADNITCAVDIKSSGGGMVEIARNVCSSDHLRLTNEIRKCADWGGEICFLVANEDSIENIEQILLWRSPCYKSGGKKGQPFTKVKGETLYKALKSMTAPNHYADGLTVRFSFCKKEHAGEKIVKILEYWRQLRKN